MSRKTGWIRGVFVSSAMLLAGCGDAELTGIYTTACDLNAFVEFKDDTTVDVERNFCEGYGREVWEYTIDDDIVLMAPLGNLDATNVVQVKFRMTAPNELTGVQDTSFLSCNNCPGDEVWVKK